MHDTIERIESVKAGSLGGIAAGISYGLMLTIDRFLLHEYSRSFVSLGLEISIAIVSGFLFGVTYRYIIRCDRNNHLNSGAVLAFGLVRGLAQVNVDEFELSQVWMNSLILSEDLTPPITLIRPLLLSPLFFFLVPLRHQFFLLITLRLNPLSSQNHTCNSFGNSLAICKYSSNFFLKIVLLPGSCLSSRLYLAQR